MLITITGNGVYDLDTPQWANYSVLYIQNTNGATLSLEVDDVPLEDGLLAANKQYTINHGQQCPLNLRITGFATEFKIRALGGR